MVREGTAGTPIGIRIDIRHHRDGNPLHWRMTSACQHGRVRPDMIVARRQIVMEVSADLGASHRAEVGCGCRVVSFTVE